MSANANAQVTRMSSKGQVVIPEDIRTALGLAAGSLFAVFGRKDANAILLKRLDLPEASKAFEDIAKWGTAHAKSKGLDTAPASVVRRQHKRRQGA